MAACGSRASPGKVTRNILQEGADPTRAGSYYWLNEEPVSGQLDPQSDYAAVLAGQVSVTPIQLERTHERSLDDLSPWAELLEADVGSERHEWLSDN